MYVQELDAVFVPFLEIAAVTLMDSIQTQSMALGRADILLVTDSEVLAQVSSLIQESCRVIQLQFSFHKDRIQPLLSLPPNTEALVCFHYYQVSVQCISMLYANGIRNLHMDAYQAGSASIKSHYDLAIVGDNSAVVPSGITRIISLGRRKLSLSTLLSIVSVLHLTSDELADRVLDYCSDDFAEVQDKSAILRWLYWDRLQIRTLMDGAGQGVLLCDQSYQLVDFNSIAAALLALHQEDRERPLREIPMLSDIAGQMERPSLSQESPLEFALNGSIGIARHDMAIPRSGQSFHMFFVYQNNKSRMRTHTAAKSAGQTGAAAKYNFSSIVGRSTAICRCIEQARQIALIDRPTLITGESGTGKELFAQSIHNHSARSAAPFLALNCAALPPNLLESELFGYTEGAFTGAKKGGHIGLLEQANGGSFFLDEIGEIPPEAQAKLLRVLEEHELMRVGGGTIIPIDVRIISATNRNLREQAKKGAFRMDLYYRLNTLELRVPPLRERREDIPLLIRHFLSQIGKERMEVSPEAMDFFVNFSWEGNIRELCNCVEYMAHVCRGTVTLDHLPAYVLQELQEDQAHTPQPVGMDAGAPGLNLSDQRIARALLRALSERCLSRTDCLALLRGEYPRLSDYHLRQIIASLRSCGLLCVNHGRRGMEVTPLGLRWVSR